MDITNIAKKTLQKAQPLRFDPRLQSLLELHGLYTEPPESISTMPVCYIRVDGWLIRLRHLDRFIRGYDFNFYSLLSLRYTLLYTPRPSHRELPAFIRYGEFTSKIASFYVDREEKRASWYYADDFKKIREARKFFSHCELDIPELIAADPDTNSLCERIASRIFGHGRPDPEEILPAVARLHGEKFIARCDLKAYLDGLEAVGLFGSGLLEKRHEQSIRACHKRIKSSLSREIYHLKIPLTYAHNDLTPGNIIEVDGTPLLLDFEKCSRASVWFDILFIYFAWGNVSLHSLYEAIRTINKMTGLRNTSLRWHMNLFVLELANQNVERMRKYGSPSVWRVDLLKQVLDTLDKNRIKRDQFNTHIPGDNVA